jgi:hypothetical protein
MDPQESIPEHDTYEDKLHKETGDEAYGSGANAGSDIMFSLAGVDFRFRPGGANNIYAA